MADDDEKPRVRPLTEQLIHCAMLDIWPGNAAVVDFGIDSPRHLGALQHAIRSGDVTPEQLDAAMGKGAELTKIVNTPENPYRDVKFQTSWDLMSPDLERRQCHVAPPKQDGPKQKGPKQ